MKGFGVMKGFGRYRADRWVLTCGGGAVESVDVEGRVDAAAQFGGGVAEQLRGVGLDSDKKPS